MQAEPKAVEAEELEEGEIVTNEVAEEEVEEAPYVLTERQLSHKRSSREIQVP